MAPVLRLLAALAATGALAGLLGGCGGSSSTASGSGGCGPAVREALDPNAGHVLPGGPEPTYLTDPPTSGAHAPGVAPTGVLDQPLSRPVQVGALEAGAVLVQYRDPGDVEALRPLAVGAVAVVPNPGLHDRVVATAWLFKQSCPGLDVAALATFAADHAGHGPGADG